MTKNKNMNKNVDETLLFGDVVKFVDEQYGEFIGTVVGTVNESKPNFHYYISVKVDRTDIVKDFEKDEKKHYYIINGKESSGVNYIFNVFQKDILEVLKTSRTKQKEREMYDTDL